MSISQICIEQHEKESRKLKELLKYSFAASILAHIIVIISLPYLYIGKEIVETEETTEPIEIIVEEKLEEEPPTP